MAGTSQLLLKETDNKHFNSVGHKFSVITLNSFHGQRVNEWQ